MTGDRAYASLWAGTGIVLAALVLVVCTAVPVRARPLTIAASPPEEEDALALLAKAHQQAGGVPYQGVRFLSAWTAAGATTLMVHVEHRPGRGTLVRVLGTNAKRPSMMYGQHARSGARGLTDVTLDLLAQHYAVTIAGKGSVAGRSAYVVEARRGDGSLAARFWLDHQTTLMLRREVRGPQGHIVRTSAFIELNVGASARLAGDSRWERRGPERPPFMPHPWQQRLQQVELATLRSQGWTIPGSLPGGLALVDARRGVIGGREVLHLSYSDGLSMVSLFVQRGRLATRKLDNWRKSVLEGCCVVYRQHTIPRRVVWAGSEQTYTVVADAPPHVVKEVVAALPHADRSRGFLGRMSRGFTQLGTWLNPFE